MVYNNKFIVVIKCNGQILREINDGEVILPFGAEYSILMKNLDTRRAVANVYIDGTDMLDGRRIVIEPNEETELRGKMINGAVKNNFKFIQKTEKIQGHRGDKIDDGMIKVDFGFERPNVFRHSYYHNTTLGGRPRGGEMLYGSSGNPPPSFGSRSSSHNLQSKGVSNDQPFSRGLSDQVVSSNANFVPQADEGITVPGSETDQQFSSTTVGSIEDHGTTILRLKGTDKVGQPISVPLTVQSKITCNTCGHVSKSGTKYCQECGTNIQV